MNTEYRYRGIPITSAIVEHLITSYLHGKQLKRSEIIETVEKIHTENGGLQAAAADFSRTVKKALQNLKEKGLAENPSTGWWLIKKAEGTEDLSSLVPEAPSDDLESDKYIEEFDSESVRGVGDEAIYVFYYPAYKKAALAAGIDKWLCKIGRTNRHTSIRVGEQAAGMPEKPVIGLVLKTDDSRTVESVIQGVLTLRGQWSEESPGTEWFTTSPDDVVRIMTLVAPSLITEETTDS